MKITKKVVFIAKEDSVEQMRELLITMIDASREEVGCELYNIYQLKNRPTEFVVVETWRDDEALKGHQNSAHYKHYKSTFEQYCAEKYSDEMELLG